MANRELQRLLEERLRAMQPDPIEGSGSGVTLFHIGTPSEREHTVETSVEWE